jgi:hypothetical protein
MTDQIELWSDILTGQLSYALRGSRVKGEAKSLGATLSVNRPLHVWLKVPELLTAHGQ